MQNEIDFTTCDSLFRQIIHLSMRAHLEYRDFEHLDGPIFRQIHIDASSVAHESPSRLIQGGPARHLQSNSDRSRSVFIPRHSQKNDYMRYAGSCFAHGAYVMFGEDHQKRHGPF
jgi:hypothetical protein